MEPITPQPIMGYTHQAITIRLGRDQNGNRTACATCCRGQARMQVQHDSDPVRTILVRLLTRFLDEDSKRGIGKGNPWAGPWVVSQTRDGVYVASSTATTTIVRMNEGE